MIIASILGENFLPAARRGPPNSPAGAGKPTRGRGTALVKSADMLVYAVSAGASGEEKSDAQGGGNEA
jgi:hypothetical protein